MNEVLWTPKAWEDFSTLIEKHESKLIKQILKLIKDIQRNGEATGIGKPEPLKHNLAGYWSREISGADRLVYRIDENSDLHIVQCKTHYQNV